MKTMINLINLVQTFPHVIFSTVALSFLFLLSPEPFLLLELNVKYTWWYNRSWKNKQVEYTLYTCVVLLKQWKVGKNVAQERVLLCEWGWCSPIYYDNALK